MKMMRTMKKITKRPALALAPTFGEIVDGRDAYISHPQLRALAKQHGRYWSFHSIPTTVALPDNRFAKSLKGFTNHQEESQFRELLREYADHGVPRPSGYADVFHKLYYSPRVPWSVNALLAPAFAGGWQAHLHPLKTVFRGTHYKYDMRSAYLWAATLGLPDSESYQRSLKPGKTKYDGIYRFETRPVAGAPFPFDQAHECIATNQEIELYGLPVLKVIDGVIWKNMLAPQKLLDAIMAVSTWKQAGRSYWGRWAQMQRIKCTANGRDWFIPNLALNIPLAHLIVSRVKMRLWLASRNAVHVFVDSVITPEKLETGDKVGDWRLEKTYTNGVVVKATGQYGSIDDLKLERMAGVPKDSPARFVI